ncbi:MAG: glycosyltransferase [Candidatus Electryonea clarkiae]|nr:glycosyltransferase [Candidatus Electryonea clarkiae]MDP8285331.1 glycosyltransferase [Candidatus Electryonea clarkiae]
MNLMLIVHIIESLLIIYFSMYFLIELSMILIFFFVWRSSSGYSSTTLEPAGKDQGISIIVPAYNEELTIVDVVEMLGESDYPEFEIIVVADGCTDSTLQKLTDRYSLHEVTREIVDNFGTSGLNKIYESPQNSRLTVIDKPNGGKADALNVGLNLAEYPYVCTIDADSILDPQALKQVAAPFLAHDGSKVVMVGGALAVANETRLVNNRLKDGKFPRNPWVIFQVIEYLRSFLVSRTGLSKIHALLILSGAFTLFRRETLMEAGGFLSPQNNHPYIKKLGIDGRHTVCEDLEVVVRLRRYLKEQKKPSKTVFLPRPICWTEVPDNARNLSRQRNRWHRGLLETIHFHKTLVLEPFYGSLGLIAMPYYLIFEAVSPIIKLLALIFIGALLVLGLVNRMVMVLLLLSITIVTVIFIGIITVIVENWGRKYSQVNVSALRYKNDPDWIMLLGMSILGDFTFAFIRMFWQLRGIWDFLKGVKSWDKFERKGFHETS